MCRQHLTVRGVISYPTFLLFFLLAEVAGCFFHGPAAVYDGGQRSASARVSARDAAGPTRSAPQESRATVVVLFSTPPLKPERGPILPRAPQGTAAGSTVPMAATLDEQPQPQQQHQQQQPQREGQRRPDTRMEDVYESLAQRLKMEIRARRGRSTAVAGRTGKRTGTVEDAVREKLRAVEGALDDGGPPLGEPPLVRKRKQPQLWVAVAGAPGSGKTTLAAEVCKRVNSPETPAVYIPMDGYHLYRRELDLLPDPQEAHRKRGAHWTFDGVRFLREVGDARRSGTGSFPGFDHARGDPVENQWAVDPSHAVILVEGNYLLLKGVDPWDEASELFDETWAIRCPPEVCGERVRKRHMQTGLGEEEALARVEDNDLPNARLISERCPWDDVDVVIDSL